MDKPLLKIFILTGAICVNGPRYMLIACRQSNINVVDAKQVEPVSLLAYPRERSCTTFKLLVTLYKIIKLSFFTENKKFEDYLN